MGKNNWLAGNLESRIRTELYAECLRKGQQENDKELRKREEEQKGRGEEQKGSAHFSQEELREGIIAKSVKLTVGDIEKFITERFSNEMTAPEARKMAEKIYESWKKCSQIDSNDYFYTIRPTSAIRAELEAIRRDPNACGLGGC